MSVAVLRPAERQPDLDRSGACAMRVSAHRADAVTCMLQQVAKMRNMMKPEKDSGLQYWPAPAHAGLALRTNATSSTNPQLSIWEGEGGATAAPAMPQSLLGPLLAKSPAK